VSTSRSAGWEPNHRSSNRSGSAAPKVRTRPERSSVNGRCLGPFVKALHYAGRTGRGRPRILRDGLVSPERGLNLKSIDPNEPRPTAQRNAPAPLRGPSESLVPRKNLQQYCPLLIVVAGDPSFSTVSNIFEPLGEGRWINWLAGAESRCIMTAASDPPNRDRFVGGRRDNFRLTY
jgi:hypothetical protein